MQRFFGNANKLLFIAFLRFKSRKAHFKGPCKQRVVLVILTDQYVCRKNLSDGVKEKILRNSRK